jgi:multiple sugar transport system substrate-binding protein
MLNQKNRASLKKTQTLSRRDFLRLAGAAGASVVLAGCSPQTVLPRRQNSEKIQLVYQDSRDNWVIPMVQEMLARFHDAHPSIQVYYSPEPEGSQNKEKKMLDEMQAGTAPDVFQGCCSWFPIWAQRGYTLDLRPYVEADLDQDDISDWDQAQYRALFTRDGQQYGLPKYHGALALYYNKDLFDRYGVTYPNESWNHTDYQEAMKRLTHDRDGDGRTDLWGSQTYITWDRIQVHVNGWGGHLVDPVDPEKIRMGEPEALAAQEWLRARMWDDRVMATPLNVNNVWPDDAFLSGQIAMLEDGSWRLRHILSNATFRLGVAPFPAGPVRRVTLTTTDGFGIYAGTNHPEAAWELVKFLTGREYGLALAQAGLLQPARLSLVQDWVKIVRETFPRQTEGVDLGAFADGHQKGYAVVGEVAANMAEATRIANEAWDQVLALGQAKMDRIAEAAAAIEKYQ